LIFFALLLIISFIDIETMMIPDFLILTGIFFGVAYSIYTGKLPDMFSGVCAGFVFMYSSASLGRLFFKKEAMGEGDIKLIVMIASYVGLMGTFVSIFSASVIGAIAGVAMLLLGKIKRDDQIPFGPFLALGALIAVML